MRSLGNADIVSIDNLDFVICIEGFDSEPWSNANWIQGASGFFPFQDLLDFSVFLLYSIPLTSHALNCQSCFPKRDANNRYFSTVAKPYLELWLTGTYLLSSAVLGCPQHISSKTAPGEMSKLQASFPAPARPVCILDRTWDDGTGGGRKN